jgi:hypothetical protein
LWEDVIFRGDVGRSRLGALVWIFVLMIVEIMMGVAMECKSALDWHFNNKW